MGEIPEKAFLPQDPLFGPIPIGLSSVKLEGVEFTSQGPVLHVSGADLMDGTPIYDIKPYLAYVDSHPEASGGFTDQIQDHKLKVDFPAGLLEQVPKEKRAALLAVLANDPRPGYQKAPDREYGMSFGNQDIHFKVDGELLRVIRIDNEKKLAKSRIFS